MVSRKDETFGTILKDNSFVNAQSRQYASSIEPNITLPKSFDGRKIWSKYLVPVRNQGQLPSCWAQAGTSALSERYGIWSLGQVRVNLSPFQMYSCEGVLKTNIPVDIEAVSYTHLTLPTSDLV